MDENSDIGERMTLLEPPASNGVRPLTMLVIACAACSIVAKIVVSIYSGH